MLQLTPLKETESFQEAFKEETIELLLEQIRIKFNFSERTMAELDTRLRQLDYKDVKDLFKAILDMKTLRDINAWLDEHISETEQA